MTLRGIYAIVNDGPDAIAIARAALDAGVGIVQYRAKAGVVVATARAIVAAAREAGALAIVDDDVEAARTFGFSGVHLGPDDDGFGRVGDVRARLGAGAVVGLSAGTPEEARAAHAAGADYLGVGAVYATASKADAGPPIGLEGLARVAAAALDMPVAAIGGIGIARIAVVRATGVAMAAVISAISDAPDPRAAADALVRAWNGAV